jgi:hypothetical protein
LKEHFHDKEPDNNSGERNDNSPLVRNPSSWTPQPHKNQLLDDCINTLTHISKNLPSQIPNKAKSNLSKEEQSALIELQDNENIIIKKADKGGAVCVMNRNFYANKITEMLNDRTTYIEVNEKRSHDTTKKIQALVAQYEHCLTPEETKYLLNFESKSSNIYGLPKIHKSKIIKEAIKEQLAEQIHIPDPQDLKFRPIVAGPINETSRLSELIDILLKDIPSQTKSYVRDDIDFLSKLNRTLSSEDEYTLTTFDVESLYTNIDQNLGCEAILYWLKQHRDKVNKRFTNNFICDAIRIVLENNTFQFDNKHYLQINGTAMGTKMAPTYANLVLAYLEEKLYTKLKNEMTTDLSNYVERNFLRYLDDCFIIWPNSKYNLSEFEKELNDLHPKLKFTKEQNTTEISFLDIRVYVSNNQVYTDIYYKLTDTHQFLPFQSCHPRHTKISIPYSQARRLCTIIDDNEIKNARLQEMKGFFLSNGYPRKVINDSIKKALSIPQHILRQPKDKSSTDIIPFVYTHNPRNPNLAPIVRSIFNILKTDSKMAKALDKSKFIPSKRQPPNLGKLLVRAKFSNKTTQGGSFKCGDTRCGNCPYMNESQNIFIKSTGRTFRIIEKMSCKSSNVLYIITCNGCQEQYVGMTNNVLAKRFTIHRQQIRTPAYRQIGVSEHIDKCSDLEIKFTVTPFYKISSDKIAGSAKEQLFINQFQPSLNKLSLSHR